MALAMVLTFAHPAAAADIPESKSPPAPRIVNIINFIRGVEPRAQIDLVEPVRRQIQLAHKHKLPTTFLIQYDALVTPAFVDLLKSELNPNDEVGAWLEVVQPQVEAAGLTWRGRYPWDWHTDVGFTIGYSPDERRRLVDVYMDRFRATFGYTPKSVGCWVLDAPTLNYAADQYGVIAACICKDQMGTDGYNLWGGYWNQAYYPSRRNAFMPAQTKTAQLNVPVFRMLGSDPINQYDTGLGHDRQGVISLEPVYPRAGGNPDWVRWFFDVNFHSPCLAFAYTQVGQENSFGWPAMSKGLEDQYALLAEETRKGRLRVETLETSGRWFRQKFDVTPATSIVALKEWNDEGRQSVWYESRFYRANVLRDHERWRLRDIHLFNENYAERYLNDNVTTHHCVYDTLPVLDGFNWSRRDGVLAGLRLVSLAADGAASELSCGSPTVAETGADSLRVTIPLKTSGAVNLDCDPRSIRISLTGASAPGRWALALAWDGAKATSIAGVDGETIRFRHNQFDYSIRCEGALVTMNAENHVVRITPKGDSVTIRF